MVLLKIFQLNGQRQVSYLHTSFRWRRARDLGFQISMTVGRFELRTCSCNTIAQPTEA